MPSETNSFVSTRTIVILGVTVLAILAGALAWVLYSKNVARSTSALGRAGQEVQEFVRLDGKTYEVVPDESGRKFVIMDKGPVPFEDIMAQTVSREDLASAKRAAPHLQDWQLVEAIHFADQNKYPGGVTGFLGSDDYKNFAASGGRSLFGNGGGGSTSGFGVAGKSGAGDDSSDSKSGSGGVIGLGGRYYAANAAQAAAQAAARAAQVASSRRDALTSDDISAPIDMNIDFSTVFAEAPEIRAALKLELTDKEEVDVAAVMEDPEEDSLEEMDFSMANNTPKEGIVDDSSEKVWKELGDQVYELPKDLSETIASRIVCGASNNSCEALVKIEKEPVYDKDNKVMPQQVRVFLPSSVSLEGAPYAPALSFRDANKLVAQKSKQWGETAWVDADVKLTQDRSRLPMLPKGKVFNIAVITGRNEKGNIIAAPENSYYDQLVTGFFPKGGVKNVAKNGVIDFSAIPADTLIYVQGDASEFNNAMRSRANRGAVRPIFDAIALVPTPDGFRDFANQTTQNAAAIAQMATPPKDRS